MTATFKKLVDGTWGVRIDREVAPGDILGVTKANGEEATVTVGEVISTDPATGVRVCSIVKKAADSGRRAGPACAECGRGGSLVRDLEDGLYKHFKCCMMPG
jgi:ribosomal protein S14